MSVVLFDHRGQPIEEAALKEEAVSPLGGVREVWFDSMATGLSPARLASVLRDLRQGDAREFITLADEMHEREAHYASVLGTRINALAGREPAVEAAGEDARSVEVADAVRALVKKPEFYFLTSDLLDALSKGFAAIEMIWDQSGTVWEPVHFEFQDQRWFQFDKKTRELRLRTKVGIMTGEALAPYRWIVHYPHLKPGFPVSGGLARLAATAFMCKNYTLKDWMRFIEVYGMPLRVGRYGPNATTSDKRILKRAVTNIGADAAAIIPDSMKIDFENAGSNNGGLLLYKGTAEWLDKQVSKAVLGQTASAEGTAGALGGQDEQADVRRDILLKDARTLAATLNRDLVRPYVDLNFGPQERYPTITWVIKDPEDVKALADSVVTLVDRGLKVKQSEMRDRMGLSDPGEDDDLLVPANAVSAPAAEPALNRARTGLNNAKPESGDVVDELDEYALNDWQPLMQPAVNAIQTLADECETAEEFKQRLPEALNAVGMDALTENLATAMFAARGAGDVGE